MSASGCDWLGIDLQHGLISDEQMRVMILAAGIRRTPVLVRVPWNEPAAIMRVLDAGADGVLVPMVNTAEEAGRVVSACRYPPLGYRSWGAVRSELADPSYSPENGNKRSVCLVQIETVQAVDNLDAILDVPGVDGVVVGPADLTISYTGRTDGAASSPRDVAMIEHIATACRERGRCAGMFCGNAKDARRWMLAGYTLLVLSEDTALLAEGMGRILLEAREPDETGEA
jgi:4-hydroxy-2-oxoheptanedioate aldolase